MKTLTLEGEDNREGVRTLLTNIKAHLPELEALLKACSDHWGYEDRVYRFYHHSYKVFYTQEATTKIVQQLQSLYPQAHLNEDFLQIVRAGTGTPIHPPAKWLTLDPETQRINQNWLAETRPLLEAFFHARFFLEVAVKYGRELKAPPLPLPIGWAALLGLYGLR